MRWVYAGLSLLVAFVWLAVLPSRPLFNPDEGRYAEIPREMLQDGDWVIPHLDGLAYVEKPPLQYWATAFDMRLFGVNAFAARLYTALTALGGIAAVWWVARRLWGEECAWRTAAVLSSLSLFAVLGQLLTLDMSLTFYMTAALCGFLAAQRPGTGSGRVPMLVAWIATAAGVLTKGPVAAVIPAAVLILYSVIARETSAWRRLHVRLGLPVFFALVVPWHWLAAQRLPDFLDFFFVHEHVARFFTPSADREEAWWFFGPVFLAGSLPWTLSGLRVLATGWRRRAAAGEFDVQRFLWVWVVFVLAFFSFSDSKLIPYVLPALPALALSIGALPPATVRRDGHAAAWLALLLGAALAAAALRLPQLVPASERSAYFLALEQPLLRIAALVALSALFVLLRRERDGAGNAVFLGTGWCLGVLLLMRAAAAVAPIYSGERLAAALPAGSVGAPVYSVGTYDQTLPFYWQRTVILAAYRGELDFGLRHRQGGEIATLDELLPAWSAAGEAFAVMEVEMFDRLKQRGVPMRELGRDTRRVLVARR